jgi:hypothetical protein
MLTTLPSSIASGATMRIPFWPFTTTRPAASQPWNVRTSVACGQAARRCYGFPYDAQSARASRTPAGWCLIGWVAADSGRKTWDVWLDVHTGEGSLRRQAD